LIVRKGISAALLTACLMIGACVPGMARKIPAFDFTTAAHMNHRAVKADPFTITTFERVWQNGKDANIYIENDGATPSDPTALRMAAADLSPNVIWIGRACQFSGMTDEAAPCPDAYLNEKRFTPEVLDAMNRVLDDVKARHGINTINLIGYGGGGSMAVLLAAWRDDVSSLRTVAAKLDQTLQDSLNPRDIAPRIAAIPQYHFIGGLDADVTPSVLRTFVAAIPKGKQKCLSGGVVHDVGSDADWVEQWPKLLSAPLACQKDIE
jgi:hypothetical protein